MTALAHPSIDDLELANAADGTHSGDTDASFATGFVSSTLAVAGRTVRSFVRTPQLMVVGSITGAMFLLIFRYVFGGAITTPGIDYVDFLVPGFLVCSILFSGSAAAAGVASDVQSGFFDRLRSLPIRRSSVLAGRSLADLLLLAQGLVVTAALGVAVGFRPEGDPAALAGAFGLMLVYGLAFGWVFIVIGLVSGSAQAAEGMSLLVFPLSFVSSANVPVSSMPGWMQPIANNQPVTAMVNAVRSLTGGGAAEVGLGHSTTYWVVVSLAWAVGIIAVFAPVAVARFARS